MNTAKNWSVIPQNAFNIVWDATAEHYTYTLPNPEPIMTEPTPAPMLNESDMSIIPEMLSRIANTIVAASSFAKDVEKLRADLETLNHDLANARQTNTTLQETIDSVRRQRDEAEEKIKAQTDRLLRNETDMADMRREYDIINRGLSESLDTNNTLRKERDDAQFTVLELTEERDRLKARLEQVNQFMANAMSVMRPDEPKPVGQSEPVPTPTPAPVVDNTGTNASVTSVETEPASTYGPAETALGFYEGHEHFNWHRATAYDQDTGQWYVPRQAVA